MSKLIVMGLVLVVGIYSITTMQMHALDHGVNGTVYILSIMIVGSLVAGFCGFKIKEVFDWWKGR